MSEAPSFPVLPDSVSSERVSVGDGVDLRVLRAGTGAPLVFVPGWSFSGDVFVHQFAELAEHYEVIAIDPRGQGGSSKPLTGNNFPQRGRDLARVIDALDLTDIAPAGWSYGALDVLSYLQQHGHDRVAKLILIDKPPTGPYDPDTEVWGEVALREDGLPAYALFLSTDTQGALAFVSLSALGVDPERAGDVPAVARLIADGSRTPEHIAIIIGIEGQQRLLLRGDRFRRLGQAIAVLRERCLGRRRSPMGDHASSTRAVRHDPGACRLPHRPPGFQQACSGVPRLTLLRDRSLHRRCRDRTGERGPWDAEPVAGIRDAPLRV